MLRGRLRKFSEEHSLDFLVENTEDKPNGVRFAVLAGQDSTILIGYLTSIIPDAAVTLVLQSATNPVLSKLKVNQADRYILQNYVSSRNILSYYWNESGK